MNVIDLETPINTEKHFAPKTDRNPPFYITEYGKTFKNTPCYQLRMNSPISCLQYVVSGKGVIICNGKSYFVGAGDTFLLPSGSDQIYYSDTDNQFERIWINFKGKLSEALIKIYGLEEIVVFADTDCKELLLKIHAACEKYRDPTEYQNRTAVLFLETVQFLSQNKGNAKTLPTTSVEQIRLFIDGNITDNIKVTDIAARFSFSEEYVIRLFKKIYGITPHKYIIQSKIRLAMIMLKLTDDSIEKIAETLGFFDSRHFSNQFKKHIGCTPSQYR